MFIIAALAIAPANVAIAQRETVAAYRECVLNKALQFRQSDLSGDTPEIAVKSATFACSRERFDMVVATEAFLSANPKLTPGDRGKVGGLFVDMQDQQIVDELKAQVAGK